MPRLFFALSLVSSPGQEKFLATSRKPIQKENFMSNQTVQKNSVVTLRFTLEDTAGQVIDDESEGLAYLHGGYGEIFPLVEVEVENKPIGHRVDLTLAPADAFGEHEEDNIRNEALADLGVDEVEVGMILESEDPDTGEPLYWQILEINGDQVLLDANHPLAGLTVRFQGEVVAIRPATPKEIEQGFADAEDSGDEDEE